MINNTVSFGELHQMNNFFEDPPVIFSTGGGEPGLTQDTIQNFKNAVKKGADVIRTNVGITRDRKIVLYSNDLFNHEAIAKSGISSFTAEDLRTRYRELLNGRAASDSIDDIPGVVPELEEAMEAFPDQRFNLHCLDTGAALMEQMKLVIERASADKRVLVSSLSGYNTRWMREMMPDVPVAFSFYGMIFFYGLFRAGVLSLRRKFNARVLIIPEMIGASYFANSGLIKQAHDRGIRVYVNPVDTDKLAREMKEAGADGVVSNNIPLVKNALNN